MIGDEPLERSIGSAVGMVEEARPEGVRSIVAVGTAGLRIATDKEHAIAVARDRTGVTIEELSEIEESRLGYLGATTSSRSPTARSWSSTPGVAAASSRSTWIREVDEQFSVKVGAARFTERFELEPWSSPAGSTRSSRRWPRISPPRRPPFTAGDGRYGRGDHEHDRGVARPRGVRPRPGEDPPSNVRRSTDRSRPSVLRRRRRASRDSSPCSPSAPK